MTTLIDAYQTGDSDSKVLSSTYWRAQTFTTSVAYDVTDIQLKLWKGGSPGTVTVSLRATNFNKPTGSDLQSSTGITNGDTLPADEESAEWRNFTLSVPVSLSSGVMYAIVIRSQNGTGGSYPLAWRSGSTGYANGNYCFSSNSGIGGSWTAGFAYDFMFRTYAALWPSGTIAGTSSLTGAIVMDKYALAGTIAGVGSLVGELGTTEAIEGTIAAVASLSGSLLYTGIIGKTNIKTIRRLVAAGNNRIYYEGV